MTQKEQALEMMMAGEDWKKITSRVSGRSSIYGALNEYFKIGKERMAELQEKLIQLDGEVDGKRIQLEGIEQDIDEKQLILKELEEDETRAGENLQEVEAKVKEGELRWKELSAKLSVLSEKGVTEKAISRIGQIDFGSGDELLTRIKTHQAHQALKKSTVTLRVERLEQKKEFDKEKEELDSIQEEIKSKQIELDETKRRSYIYEEALSVAQSFIQDGYDKDILEDLKTILNSLALKGSRKTSIKRLLDGLFGVKELAELESELRNKRTELATTEKDIDKAKGILQSVEETTLKQIEALKDKTIQQLEQESKNYRTEMKNLHTEQKENLANFSNQQNLQLETHRKNNEAELSKRGEQLILQLAKLHIEIKKSLKSYDTDIKKWGQIKQELGRNEEFMRLGYVMLGILETPESIKQIPLHVIAQLLSRINTWTFQNMYDARTYPSDNVKNLENNLYRQQNYRLCALTLWLQEEFSKRTREGLS